MCTSSSRSCMSSKDLVCCLALIYYGSSKERMQRKLFLYTNILNLFIFCYLVLYLIFVHNVSNSNGTLRWQDVEDFLSQCGDHPPEELDTIFQNV